MSDTQHALSLRPVDRFEILMKADMRRPSNVCHCRADCGLSLIVTAPRDGVARAAMFDAGPVEAAADLR